MAIIRDAMHFPEEFYVRMFHRRLSLQCVDFAITLTVMIKIDDCHISSHHFRNYMKCSKFISLSNHI